MAMGALRRPRLETRTKYGTAKSAAAIKNAACGKRSGKRASGAVAASASGSRNWSADQTVRAR